MVEEAAQLADEVGLDQLTLAALAERLGVRQPSLYKHIESMASLQRGISLGARREMSGVLGRAAVGRSGAAAIHAMSRAYRSWATLHPGRYRASNVMPAPGDVEGEATALEVVRIIADVLVGYALEGDDAIDAIRAFRSTLHGFVTLETDGGFALSADVERSFERLIHGFVVALDRWTEPSEHEGDAGPGSATPPA